VKPLQNLLTLTFVVSSMFSMGLALTPRQILRPLKNVKGVTLALIANFVVVPAAAYLLASTLDDPDFRIGLILIGTGAGAAFLLKLTPLAKGDVVLAVSVLVLLVVVTVAYLPLMLPVLLPGIEVPAWAIAKNLSLQMLLPLGLGLAAHARYEDGSIELLPDVQKIANISLVLLLVLLLTTNFGEILGMLGTGAIGATIALVGLALLAGWLLSRRDPAVRATVALAAGQRNLAAAFVVAGGSFADRPRVFGYLAGATVIMLTMNFAFAGELRRRRLAREPSPPGPKGAPMHP
jgi:BASS family bile acid:Na+ symporter